MRKGRLGEVWASSGFKRGWVADGGATAETVTASKTLSRLESIRDFFSDGGDQGDL